MFLKSYKHIVPTIDSEDCFYIEGLERDANFNLFYRKLNKDFLLSVEAENLGLIYCPPMPIASSHSKCLNINKLQHTHAHKYVNAMKNANVSYVDIDGSACASSLVAIAKAFNLINYFDFKDVMVIADERISKDVSDLFAEMNIGVKGGDGFSALHFCKDEPKDSFIKITNTAIGYHYNSNPWLTCEEGYSKVIKTDDYACIKPHGTGTGVNNEAEERLCKDKKVILSPEGLRYKEKYGHMQGASGSTEICQMLDEHSTLPRTLCLASGLGNFYGGLIIEKKS